MSYSATNKSTERRPAPVSEDEIADYEIDGDALLGDAEYAIELVEESGASAPGELQLSEELIGEAASEKIKQLEAENKRLSGCVDRLKAEFEGMRRRQEREQEEAFQQIRTNVLRQILPLVDNFERAMQHVANIEVNEDFATGIALLHKQLFDLLEQNNVIQIISVGEPFDPNVHEAVFIEPTPGCEQNTVIAEYEKGYTIGIRLLRPARVKVAVRPS